MSRALGRRSRLKMLYADTTPEARGRAMFERGDPCPYVGAGDHGKARAMERGWQRAATAARTKAAGK